MTHKREKSNIFATAKVKKTIYVPVYEPITLQTHLTMGLPLRFQI
jgi:hypothetical protein